MTDSSRQCQYKRKKRARCKARAHNGSPFCFFHDPALDSQRAAARKAGGIARTRKLETAGDFAVKSLRTAAEVSELLGETINQVRRGEIDPRVSNAVGYLSGILLSAIEKSSLEQRLANLEAVFASRKQASNDLGENESFDFVQQNAGHGPTSPQ